MSNHVTEWLYAYLDDELHGSRLHHVEEHLAECESCLAELQSLEKLSRLLHEVPAPEFTPPERFATQVNLRLPHQQSATPKSKFLEIGWWMIPVGLLAVWVFISTTILLSNVVSTADNFGLLDNTTASWISAPSDTVDVTSTLGQFGVLRGDGLQWAEMTENFTRNAWPQIVLQVSVALLYLTWFAIWWARHTRDQRQQHGQLLEG
jgi:hypothetical protein